MTEARRTGWGVAVVRGRSMEPALRDGDRLLVRWRGRHAVPGQVVVVRLPGDRPIAVKRLTAVEGDGRWVERDNPREGVDSWQVGAVAERDVLGVARCRLWPRPGRVPAPRVPVRPARRTGKSPASTGAEALGGHFCRSAVRRLLRLVVPRHGRPGPREPDDRGVA